MGAVRFSDGWHITQTNKEIIQKELDRMGINNSTMFPEIEKAALYIRDAL
jgi:hypothetical protein